MSPLLPPGLLPASQRHLSGVSAGEFYLDSGHFATYVNISGDTARPLASPENLQAAFGAETSTPSRPNCLKSKISPAAASSIVAALTNLNIDARRDEIVETMKNADRTILDSLNIILSVPSAQSDEELQSYMAGAIAEVFQATSSPTLKSPARVRISPGDEHATAGRSLRDDTLGDDVCRNAVAALSIVRNSMRLTVRALRRRGLLPSEFVPLTTLPIRVVQQISTHLRLQACVQALVSKAVSINGPADARTALIIRDRLASLDVFMAEQIDDGVECAFSAFERTYGILSVGCFAAFAATFNYVPGDSPVVLALYAAAKNLSFGPGGVGVPVNFRHGFVPFLALLNQIDEFEIIFDVKTVYIDLVSSLKRLGVRGKEPWDDMVLREIEIANGLKQKQSAVRDVLDSCTRLITKMQRHQERIDVLHGNPGVAVNSCTRSAAGAEEDRVRHF